MSHHFSAAIDCARMADKIKNLPLHMLYNMWISLLHYYLQNAEMFTPNESVLERYGEELITSYVALISK